MRVSRIRVERWRNLRDLTIELDPDADFICLVGENGTGKSHLLDLLHFAGHHFGLIEGLTSKRQPPYVTEEPYRVEVRLTLGSEWREYLSQPPAALGAAYDAWNGDLVFESYGDKKDPADPVPDAPHGAGGTSSATYYAWHRVLAAGLDEPDSYALGQQVVQRLREAPEVLHLYIDAERVFPPAEVQDQEVIALSRQQFDAPWIRRQAAILTQNLYIEWMRSMLAQQQRMQSEYFQRAQEAKRTGEAIPEPEDFLDDYRAALLQVLAHLEFLRLDHERRRLIYNSAGVELPYEDLSGGERELAFLVGQIARFGIRRGLFLLDEPELHLNAALLRGWLEYLRGAVETGQVWIATHVLEAAEAAGLDATLVLERSDDRVVRSVAPLGNRPALRTLAGQLGSPAFSVGTSRFLLIEGDRPGRERERFTRVLDSPPRDRFLESGGHREVLSKLATLRSLASEEEQLQVGGFIDRDFRTDQGAARSRG